MGESEDPKPDTIILTQGLYQKGVLYVGVKEGDLNLRPWLRWDLAMQRVN